MSSLCGRCGIGHRVAGGACDWCAAPARLRLPLWTAAQRWLPRSRIAAALRRCGPMTTGVAAGVLVHLVVAAIGVAFGLPLLWQTGLLWSEQWWWALAPEPAQPWAFAAFRGAAYGGLAGLAAAWQVTPAGRPSSVQTSTAGYDREAAADQTREREQGQFRPGASSTVRQTPSPATVTALAAFVISGWEPAVGTQHRLVAAALGAAVGWLTTLLLARRGMPE